MVVRSLICKRLRVLIETHTVPVQFPFKIPSHRFLRSHLKLTISRKLWRRKNSFIIQVRPERKLIARASMESIVFVASFCDATKRVRDTFISYLPMPIISFGNLLVLYFIFPTCMRSWWSRTAINLFFVCGDNHPS